MKVHDNAIRSAMGLIEASCNFTASATRIITEVREIGLERGRRSPHAFEYQRPFYSLSVCLIKGRNAVPAVFGLDFSMRVCVLRKRQWQSMWRVR